jgi:hypothetical protein
VVLPRMGLRLCFLALLAGVVFVCGCSSQNKDSGPRIVSTSDLDDPLASLPAPYSIPDRSYSLGPANAPAAWYPPKSIERHWQSIVVHHSATQNGNMAIFDKWHRERNHWDGVGYDFVIGNGTDSRDGLIEVTFRWDQQITGAHCKTPGNWANENAVGICLVGNFDESWPSRAQMKSLTQLVQFLSARYRIPTHQIYGHNSTPGANVTNCPGEHLGLSSVRSMLSK